MSTLHPIFDPCLPTADAIAAILDGASLADYPAVREHSQACPVCSSQLKSARLFLRGVARLPNPTPSPDLGNRIFAAVVRDRARRKVPSQFASRIRNWALAAGILIAVGVMMLWSGGSRMVEVRTQAVTIPRKPVPVMSLQDRINRVGTELVSRTQEVSSRTLPKIDFAGAFSTATSRTPNSTISTFAEVRSGATSTLEPIASSAKRAFDLFRREVLPSNEPTMKPNS